MKLFEVGQNNLHGEDVITFDVPTLIRALEWAREDVEDDKTIHEFITKLLKHPVKVVDMKLFNKIMVDF